MDFEMKKKVAVFITVDLTKRDGATGVCKAHHNFSPADETYEMFIYNDNPDGVVDVGGVDPKEVVIDAAAHEFGHLLSGILELPHGMQDDPRTTREAESNVAEMLGVPELMTPDQCKREYANESLAWDLAERIRPSLSKKVEVNSLATYNSLRDIAEGK